MALATFAIGDGAGSAAQCNVDPTFSAARVSMRPAEYGARGHYRAAGASGASVSVGAGSSGVLANFMPPISSSLFYVVTRIQVAYEVLTAITAAAPIDFQAFHYTGATGVSAGTASTTATPTKMKAAMAPSAILNLSTSGEIRTIGTGTTLTAATGKTNDGTAFAAVGLQTLVSTSATGTATQVTAGNAVAPVDLFKPEMSNGEHPIVLTGGEGIEIQTITAGPSSGTAKYVISWVWYESAVAPW